MYNIEQHITEGMDMKDKDRRSEYVGLRITEKLYDKLNKESEKRTKKDKVWMSVSRLVRETLEDKFL